jgi:hypothetical protein
MFLLRVVPEQMVHLYNIVKRIRPFRTSIVIMFVN